LLVRQKTRVSRQHQPKNGVLPSIRNTGHQQGMPEPPMIIRETARRLLTRLPPVVASCCCPQRAGPASPDRDMTTAAPCFSKNPFGLAWALVRRDCGDEHARERRHGPVGLDKPGRGGVCVLESVLSVPDFPVKTASVMSLLGVNKSLLAPPNSPPGRGFVDERHEKWASSREQIQRAEQGEEHAERGAWSEHELGRSSANGAWRICR
jgi:hypothetical protein